MNAGFPSALLGLRKPALLNKCQESPELRTLGESYFPEEMQEFLRNFDVEMHNTLGSSTWGARNTRLFYAGMQKSGDTEFPVTSVTSKKQVQQTNRRRRRFQRGRRKYGREGKGERLIVTKQRVESTSKGGGQFYNTCRHYNVFHYQCFNMKLMQFLF